MVQEACMLIYIRSNFTRKLEQEGKFEFKNIHAFILELYNLTVTDLAS